MAFTQDFLPYTIVGSVDLSDSTAGTGLQYKAIDLTTGGVATRNSRTVGGILRHGGVATEHATLMTLGIMKFVAYQGVSAGDQLSVYSGGYMYTADSGDLVYGRVLDADVASGAVGTGFFDFSNPVPFEAGSMYQFRTVVVFSATNNLSAAAQLGSPLDARSGDLALTGGGAQAAQGVLVSSPTSGTIGFAQAMGLATVRAGDVIAKGRSLTVADSYFVPADSGDIIFGRAVGDSAAANSGGGVLAAINMATPHYATSCLDVMY